MNFLHFMERGGGGVGFVSKFETKPKRSEKEEQQVKSKYLLLILGEHTRIFAMLLNVSLPYACNQSVIFTPYLHLLTFDRTRSIY